MSLPPSPDPAPVCLDDVLGRTDVWRGRAQGFRPQACVDTGYAGLNSELLGGGWPLSSFIEICQPTNQHAEWLLLLPALCRTTSGYIVLLNPPALPFAPALAHMGLDLERLLIVNTHNKADFLASFFELCRAQACDAVVAWQPRQVLSYSELRKCLLASADGLGLYVFYRPATQWRQSSPASLRLKVEVASSVLRVEVFKQKGLLQLSSSRPVYIPFPDTWHKVLPHRALDEPVSRVEAATSSPAKGTPVGKLVPLRGR